MTTGKTSEIGMFREMVNRVCMLFLGLATGTDLRPDARLELKDKRHTFDIQETYLRVNVVDLYTSLFTRQFDDRTCTSYDRRTVYLLNNSFPP